MRRGPPARVHCHQPAQAMGINGGKEVTDQRSERMADQMHMRQTERVAEHEQVIDVVGDAIAMRWLTAPASSAQVQCDDIPAVFGKDWPKLRPFLVAVSEAMHEQHGPLWLAELAPGHIV